MKNPLLLTLFIVGVALFIIFYFVSSFFYKKRHNTKYHFYQMFPYEFNYPTTFKENLYGNIFFVLATLCITSFYIVNPLGSIYRVLAIVLSIMATMVFICLLIIPVRYLRTYMVLASISMGLAFIIPLVNLFLAFNEMKAGGVINKALHITSMVASGLIALTMTILILNPRLTFKIYMDKENDQEGNEVLKRPKVIFMALNEWWAIFVYFLSPLALLFLFI